MSQSLDPTLRDLTDCGCCEGRTAQTPVRVVNRPGLSAIAYRIGTHAQFKQAMLAQLSAAHLPALQDLRTRDDDDFSIALLDAWATVADVLTFYQERIANESYWRTATERLSLLHLSRLIGYELRPGLAAYAYLAFALDEIPQAAASSLPTSLQPSLPTQVTASVPTRTVIGIGTRVQSIPGPDERSQIFETIEKIEAHVEWNAIRPRLTQPQIISTTMSSIWLQGTSLNLRPGDWLLITVPGTAGELDWALRRVSSAGIDDAMQRTHVQLESVPTASARPRKRKAPFTPDEWREAAASGASSGDDHTARQVIAQHELETFALLHNLSIAEAAEYLAAEQASTDPQPGSEVYVFRVRASLFGHNAPTWDSRYFPPLENWEEKTLKQDIGSAQHQIYLDNVYPGIVAGEDSWLALKNPTTSTLYEVQRNDEISRSDFAISAKVTRLTLDSSADFEQFKLRETMVLAQSEKLYPVDQPDTSPIQSDVIELDRRYDGLQEGQVAVVSGVIAGTERQDSEVVVLARVDFDVMGNRTILRLVTNLANAYQRDTVTLNANVALATHGETVHEVLGSGDASQSHQRFTLRQPPLTYVIADTPSGAESTLQVYVNDVQWHESPSLYKRGSEERVYVTRMGDDGKTTLQFGDGQTGARLPTGQENVRATYRKGSGLEGLVKANRLTLLLTRPLGVKSVTNPLPAQGAEDPESRDDARRNAPLTVLTLDRIVSLQDYEDFARAYGGIDKALATWTWIGEKRGVLVTVAGPQGALIPESSKTYENLLSAMKRAGDPRVPLRVKSYRPALFTLFARTRIDADYQPERVLAEVEQALRLHFSFEARQFGQAVMLCEVIAVIQDVPGVVGVNVEELHRVDPDVPGVIAVNVGKLHRSNSETPLPPVLYAAAPQAGSSGEVSAAELLTLDPRPLNLGTM